MKKLIAFLLSIAIALPMLSSCEVPVNISDDTDDTTHMIVDTSDMPITEDDPTKDEYGFTLFAKGEYIVDPKFDTDEFLPEYDANYNAGRGSVANCAADDAVYFVEAKTREHEMRPYTMRYISYMDKSTGFVDALCGDSSCEHFYIDGGGREGCKAYIGGKEDIPDFMAVYDGLLCGKAL